MIIKKNPYFDSCKSSAFSNIFNNVNPDSIEEIQIIHVRIKYPTQWRKNTDFFQFLLEKDRQFLKNKKEVFFVFDASVEGFDPFEYYFFDNLYYSCKVHKIPPKKILFVSANLKDEKNITLYNQKYDIKESINVFCFNSFKKSVHDLYESKNRKFDSKKKLTSAILRTERNFKNKFFLSLSRINRSHRTLAQFLLHDYNLDVYGLLSHDKLDLNSNLIRIHYAYGLDKTKFLNWAKKLPLIADTRDFKTNHALSLSKNLHDSTLFQIVNETHVDNFENRSLFYSEKTFQPMVHFQPFLIFGQQYCNQRLEDHGFKIYDDYFDYSFDDEPDFKKRYLKIIDTVKTTVENLKMLKRRQQIDWKFKNQEKLIHNYNMVLNKNYEKEKFLKLAEKLRKISDDFVIPN